jgi:hypothetical protein
MSSFANNKFCIIRKQKAPEPFPNLKLKRTQTQMRNFIPTAALPASGSMGVISAVQTPEQHPCKSDLKKNY